MNIKLYKLQSIYKLKCSTLTSTDHSWINKNDNAQKHNHEKAIQKGKTTIR